MTPEKKERMQTLASALMVIGAVYWALTPGLGIAIAAAGLTLRLVSQKEGAHISGILGNLALSLFLFCLASIALSWLFGFPVTG